MNIARILRRWDAIAHAQLVQAAATLAAENEVLIERAWRAESDAESWRDDCLAALGNSAALTRAGRIVRRTGAGAL